MITFTHYLSFAVRGATQDQVSLCSDLFIQLYILEPSPGGFHISLSVYLSSASQYDQSLVTVPFSEAQSRGDDRGWAGQVAGM